MRRCAARKGVTLCRNVLGLLPAVWLFLLFIGISRRLDAVFDPVRSAAVDLAVVGRLIGCHTFVLHWGCSITLPATNCQVVAAHNLLSFVYTLPHPMSGTCQTE